MGAVGALVATSVSLGVAELVRAVDPALRSPVIDVGSSFIDATPRWLKDLAIDWFGTSDKVALLVGIGVVMALSAAVVGALASRRRWIGPIGVGCFAALGAISSAAQGPWWSAAPSVVGGAAGAWVIWFLIGRVELRADAGAGTAAPAIGGSAHPAIAGLSDDDRAALGGGAGAAGVARRSFLVAAAAAAGVAALTAGTGRWLAGRFDVALQRAQILLPRPTRPLPELPASATLDDVEGITPFVTDNAEFYRIDTALVAPQVPLDTWTLTVDGMVDRSIELTYDDLLARDLVESDITLSCVSNEVGGTLAGNARWLGVPLAELLAEAGVHDGADQIVGRSTDGFTAGFPVRFGVERERGALVAIGMNGEPLPVEHGFPARLVVPGLYGYVSATKWLTRIELTTFESFDAYWVQRDWAREGPIKTFSRIDTPGALAGLEPGEHPIAGVAWAQTRGIDAVEVRVDGGEWRRARLADEVDDRTWRQWVLPHDFSEPGRHTLECRAIERGGAIQTEQRSEPFPDGASGWHSVVVLVG